ncbi:MAG: ribose 5-phosphate isomerase B [Clostridia bacterium]|nr:ribose 5-phosphate isomerase B [Clostridia bacterium]
MKIAIGNDHAGVEMKNQIADWLREQGCEIINVGNDDPADRQDDYPIYGYKVAKLVKDGEAELGICICGTGVGISLAANRVRGIRACVCSEPYTAQLSRRHNNTNVLCFGARVIGIEMAKMIVKEWLEAKFEGGRHQRRIDMIREIEETGRLAAAEEKA